MVPLAVSWKISRRGCACSRIRFRDLLSEPASRPWSPAVDIYETENELVLKADIPDVDPNDVGHSG